MRIRGIIFITLAVLGAILNFSAKLLSEKTKFSELTIKAFSFIVVLISITLLFIFGK